MSEPKTCPQCGGGIPEGSPDGQCPPCMLRAGLGEESSLAGAGPAFEGDRNLLFGVFAVQLRKVTPQEVMSAAAAWAADASKDLPTRLKEQGVLAQADVEFIARLVDEAVRAHGGDIEATLHTLGGDQVLQATFGNSIDLTHHRYGAAVSPVYLDGKPIDPDSVPGVQETPGRYTHVSEHARGGMGRVLLVHDGFLGRNVALKELMPGQRPTSDPDNPSTPVRQYMGFLSRFLQEARITGQLEHPSIVPVYELGHRQDGTLYYTMKLVRGKTLREAINQCKSIQERLGLLAHFVDLCQAVAYAHSRGIVHRDIKPDNVMVGEFGETVVLDWGLAKSKDREDCHADGLAETIRMLQLGDVDSALKTQYGQVMGTPGYMSPEQALGRMNEVDEKSDAYSLGAVLYQMLSGRPPFTGRSVPEILQKVVDDDPEGLDTNAVPPELAAICMKAMAKRADDRYTSASAMADEVRRFQTGAIVQAYSYGFAHHLKRFAKRHKATLTIAMAALVLLFSVIGVAVYRIDAARRQSEASLYAASIAHANTEIQNDRAIYAEEPLLAAPQAYRGWEWGLLAAQSHPQVLTLRDTLPASGRGGCAFSSDGRLIATGVNEGQIRIWDAQSGVVKHRLKLEDDNISTVGFSDDSRYLLASNLRGHVALWDAHTGEHLHRFQGSKANVRHSTIDALGKTIAAASMDGNCYLWDISSRELRATLTTAEKYAMLSVAFTPDGRYVATGTTPDGVLRIWDVESATEVRQIKAHDKEVVVVMFDNTGKRIVTSGAEDIVRIWNWESGELVREFKDQWGAVFAPDGDHVLTNDVKGGQIITWDIASGEAVLTSDKMPDVKRIWADVPSQRLLVPAANGDAHVYSLYPRNDVLELSGHAATMLNVAFSPNSRLVATSTWSPARGTTYGNHPVIVWDVATGTALRSFDGFYYGATDLSFLPDGDRILVAHGPVVRIWRISSGEKLQEFPVTHDVGTLVVTPDGKTIIVTYRGTNDEGFFRIELWNIETQKSVARLGGDWATIDTDYLGPNCASYDPQGRFIAFGSWQKRVVVYDANSHREVTRLSTPEIPRSLSVSPDGALLAVSGFAVSSVSIWDTRTWTQSVALASPGGGVSFSPDGTRLVVGAQIWDTRTWKKVLTLPPSEALGQVAVFSPDGRTLATAEGDLAVLWSTFPWKTRDSGEFSGSHPVLLDDLRRARESEVRTREAELAPELNCMKNLRALDLAVLKWADTGARTVGEASPTPSELGEQLGVITCPSGGVYPSVRVGEFPKCTIHGTLRMGFDVLVVDFEAVAKETNPSAVESRRARLEAVLPHYWWAVMAAAASLSSPDSYKEPRVAAALVLAKKAIEMAPDDKQRATAIWGLADIELKAGNFDEAVSGFRQVLKSEMPNSTVAALEFDLVSALIKRGADADLRDACEIIVRLSQLPILTESGVRKLNGFLDTLRSIDMPQDQQTADQIRKTLEMFPNGLSKSDE